MYRFIFVFCLLSLFISTSVSAQTATVMIALVESLDDAKTVDDLYMYAKHGPHTCPNSPVANLEPKQKAALFADIFTQASEKAFALAKSDDDRWLAYKMKFDSLWYYVRAEVEGAEQKLETFLNELDSHEDELISKNYAVSLRFFHFQNSVLLKKISHKSLDELKSELKTQFNWRAFCLMTAQLALNVAEQKPWTRSYPEKLPTLPLPRLRSSLR